MSNLKEDTPIPDPAQPGSADLSTVLPPRVDSAGDYLRASFVRIKGGESGMLPVIAGLLLGSETQKVLTHSKIPVLIVR